MKKVLEKTTDPALIHHALSLEAIALFCLGKKEEARESFEKILKQNFEDLRFAANLNYKAVELFVKKNFIKDVCQMYLTKALALAKSKKEKTYELIIENLLKLI